MVQNEKEIIQKVYGFIVDYDLQNNNKTPVINVIAKAVNLDRKKTIKILQLLAKHKYLEYRDYRYRLPEQKRFKKPKQENQIPKEMIQNIKSHKITIFKITLTFILILFVIMSIQANFKGLSLTKDFYSALSSSIGFVFCSIIFLDLAIFFFTKKMKIWILFFILFILLFSNNFLNILSGQFNDYQKIVSNKENTINKQLLFNQLVNQENELQIELTHRYDELTRYDLLLKTEPKNKSYLYKTINLTNYKIPDLKIQLEKIRTDKKELLNENKINEIKKVTIYDFLSFLFKKPANILQLIHLIFPAFMLDIISSINLSLILFLKNDYEIKEKLNENI
jgi:energy-coupling factor transporter transmembrane protein EcfT